jgi:uncharacterized cupredoxin-like copper-binding protein
MLLVCAAGLAVSAGGAFGAVSLTSATKVSATEKEFKITLAQTSAKAGTVTFSVKNAGHLDHEFIVSKTKLPASKLPVKGTKAVVPNQLGLIKPFKPGQTKTLTLKLPPGHYVLLCNIPAHYQAGQRADFTVR